MVGADETTDLWRECLRDILQCNPWSQYQKKKFRVPCSYAMLK